ncbi:MAG TPA: hypothetical protein VK249_14825 [Anaerolineales bacterium]|nr:hypothetical protein [Anaerolineales bacterium]
MTPPLTNVHSSISNQFFNLQTIARREALWAKLMGKDTRLATFPEQAPEKSSSRKCVGIQDIPVEQINGTLNTESDFDLEFRPLKTDLQERWVNAYLTFDTGAWSPILVHQLGENYYVEDGHHRVSVARQRGMTCIRAKIWQYPVQVEQSKKCPTVPCAERSLANVYAAE